MSFCSEEHGCAAGMACCSATAAKIPSLARIAKALHYPIGELGQITPLRGYPITLADFKVGESIETKDSVVLYAQLIYLYNRTTEC